MLVYIYIIYIYTHKCTHDFIGTFIAFPDCILQFTYEQTVWHSVIAT